MKRIVTESGILECKDTEWPKPDKIGKQELVVRVGEKEVTLTTSKIGSYAEVQKNKDSEGLTIFFYLVQDLKCFVFSLVNLHFRVRIQQRRSNLSDFLYLWHTHSMKYIYITIISFLFIFM
jgi:protein mago nashi